MKLTQSKPIQSKNSFSLWTCAYHLILRLLWYQYWLHLKATNCSDIEKGKQKLGINNPEQEKLIQKGKNQHKLHRQIDKTTVYN